MADLPSPTSRNLVRLPGGELLYTPSPRLRAFYLLLLILVVWIGILPWFILAAVTLPGHLTLTLVLPLLLVILAIRWYIPKYWASIRFRFNATGVVCEKGVWRVDRRVVPYSKIRGVEIACGPFCRYQGIASLRIVLDDGSTLRLPGVEDPAEVRRIIKAEIM
ncbi:MAG: Bacterial membrane flanked domain protein [Methanoregulaceae archaeon PtaB.Bin009]|jgi:membrane protein YdbS with pleckstrin-like domain|nr:MAG: Bacterial membrane flanked domain protein [Methanoregulaceae archaeon PtaB.Bin009]OPY41627.1 MAG: Bacterial membrane flanked domain protein [Methanoregulaceae archaeon PtaU1.Bin066]HNQ29804.1 PH domain-containing protein [Methanolinea sp.]